MAARAWMSWSTGKDSALALHRARQDPALEVVGLLSTVDQDTDRVAMHGVRRELLDAQAARLDLPAHVVELPWPCPNDIYEQRMRAALARALDDGVERMIFGDLYLADIRAYRERMLEGTRISPVFPLWGEPTDALAREMLDVGIDAVVTCVDMSALPADYSGRRFDAAMLASLPAGVDPCGEQGEFHTFTCYTPGFSSPVEVIVGSTSVDGRFATCDLLPEGRAARERS